MSIADRVRDWAPAPLELTETLSGWPAAAFAGLLDQPAPGPELPPLWTALHFLEHPATTELGEDGHPREGHFLPPVENRRRMFAGGRLRVHGPLRIGDEISRRTALTSVTPKSGRSGDMLFVTLTSEYVRAGEVVQVEEQDIVYRQQEPGAPRGAPATAPEPGPPPAPAERQIVLAPDEVMLFRMSALTYNAHRIHVDLPYARAVEGYPGLVVHGPLLALLLLELPRRFAPDRRVTEFAYRLRRPSFAGAPLVAAATEETGDSWSLRAGAPGAEPSITGTAILT